MCDDSRQSLRLCGEESPDCTEQEVLLLRKDTANYMSREGKCHRNYTASFEVRVKWWSKSPPGAQRERRREVNPFRSKTK